MPALVRLAAALLAATIAAPLLAQPAPAAGRWFAEGGLGVIRPVDQPATNVDVGGPGPLTTLRVGRGLASRLALTASASIGGIADARREEYPRPNGARRVDRYDYGVLAIGTGVEYAWPMGRLTGLAGVEAGAVWERHRLVENTDPMPIGSPPSSSTGVTPLASLRLGTRYPLTDRASVGALLHLLGGAGTIERGDTVALPQLVLRWSF